MENIKTKRCSKCEAKKSIDEFYKDRTAKDGLSYWCKGCSQEYEHERLSLEENKEKARIRTREWRKLNPGYDKEWYKNNPQKKKNNNDKYRQSDKGKRRRAKREKEKRQANPVLKLNQSISRNINNSLKDRKGGRHWENLVGYTLNNLVRYLESLFTRGMTWENYGKGKDKWHVDHIIPISLFNITVVKSKGFKTCWALENLRPMWGSENLKKHNKLFY